MAKAKGVWKSDLDRFGYDLVCIAETENDAKAAISAEYCRAYAHYNNLDHDTVLAIAKDKSAAEGCDAPYREFAEDYENAMDEAKPSFYEFGDVVWE